MKVITMAQWINLFSEQGICIVDAIYILCKKNWTRTHSETHSYGRQMTLTQNTGKFGFF